ncbi:MAG: hypothetical protein V1656_00010 [Candidatus Jorgensenbacteria bacterium]
MAHDSKITEEEAQKTAEAHGRRLGFLIATLNVSDETKQALLALLPAMTLEQIDRLSELLVKAFVNEQTKEFDEDFARELELIKKEHAVSCAALETNIQSELDALEQKLKERALSAQ